MQFSFQKSFGYPVLRPGSDDYTNGAFQASISPKNVSKGQEYAEVSCTFVVSVPEIKALIREKKAAFALIIDCRDTFYRQLFETFDAANEFQCQADMLKGKVTFEAYVIVKEEIEDYHSRFIDDFYGHGPHKFSPGMVLAQDAPVEKNVHAEKLRDSRSLLSFSADENLNLGEWHYDVMNEFPAVYVSPEQLKWIKDAPPSSNPIIENTFLVPIVSSMISAMRDEERAEDTSTFPWTGVIVEGLQKLDLTLSDYPGDDIRLAQRFLGMPLARQNELIRGNGD
jgi:hypothetical protein